MNSIPFNLEDALNGAPVMTRGGRKVSRIVQFPEEHLTYPIMVAIENNPHIMTYTRDGRYDVDLLNSTHDLVMAPRTFRIGDVDVPLPETVNPFDGQQYYAVDLNSKECFWTNVWRGYDWQVSALKRGLVHLNPSHAEVHGKALLKLHLHVPNRS